MKKWPYSQRESAGIALTVIGIGVGTAVGLLGVFASIHGTRPGYRWWWPNWSIALPVLFTLYGVLMLVVPTRRGPSSQPASPLEASSRPTAAQRYLVGDGVQGYAGWFSRAVKELANQTVEQTDGTRQPVSILDPRSEVYQDGPGVVQDFDSCTSEYGWALCALEGRPVVAVDGKIWNELRAAGSAALSEHPRAALGYPVPDEDSTRRIDADALCVELTGGTWGDAQFLRDAIGRPWRWEPKPSFSMQPIPEAASRDRESEGERLRMRVVSVLPLAKDSELAITTQRHHALPTQLADSEITRCLVHLSAARGVKLVPSAWRTGPNGNARDRLSYSCDLVAPDGRVVLFVHVFMQVGKYMSADIETWVELEVRDLDAWRSALVHAGAAAAEDLRISTAEVGEFFAIAWYTATVFLPAAAGERLPIRYTRPPQTQLIFATDRDGAQPYPPLENYVDLGPLGPSGRDQLPRMSIALTAAPPRDLGHAASLCAEALAEMAQHFEYIDATSASFT
jgi:hypothetical protein